MLLETTCEFLWLCMCEQLSMLWIAKIDLMLALNYWFDLIYFTDQVIYLIMTL